MKTQKTPTESSIDVYHLIRCSEDLMYAARRVRNKYGRGKNDTLLNWTEWTDVDDAVNAIEKILLENVQTHPPAGGEENPPETLTNQPNPTEPTPNGGLGDVSCSALVDGPNAYTYALDVSDDLKHHDEKMSKRYQNALKSGEMKPEEVLFWCFKTLHLLHFRL